MNRQLYRCAVWVIVAHLAAGICLAAPQGVDYRLDDEVFGRGLIQRGLDQLWERYDQQHPPTTDLQLLARQIVQGWADYLHAEDYQIRAKALRSLLELQQERLDCYGDNPVAAVWQLRHADDLLHCQGGGRALVQLIGLALSQDQRREFSSTLDEVTKLLDTSSRQLRLRLGALDNLSEEQLEQINRQGLPEVYQGAVQQGRYLRIWIDLHKLLLGGKGKNFNTQGREILESADKLLETRSAKTRGALYLLKAIVSRHMGDLQQAQAALDKAKSQSQPSQQFYLAVEQIQLALLGGRGQFAHKLATSTLAQLAQGQVQVEYRQLARTALLVQQGLAGLAELHKRQDGRGTPADRQGSWGGLTQFLAENTDMLELVYPKIAWGAKRWGPADADKLSELELLAMGLDYMDKSDWQTAAAMLGPAIQGKLPRSLEMTAKQAIGTCYYQRKQLPQAVEHLLAAGNGYVDQNSRQWAYQQAAAIAWEFYAADRSDGQVDRAKLLVTAAKSLLDHYPDGPHAERYRVLGANALLDLGQADQVIELCDKIKKDSPWYPPAVGQRVRALCQKHQVINDRPADKQALEDRLRVSLDELEKLLSVESSATPSRADQSESQIKQWIIAKALLAGAETLTETQGRYAARLLAGHRELIDSYPQLKQRAEVLLVRALLAAGTCEDLQQACSVVAGAGRIDDQYKLPTGVAVLEKICQVLSQQFPRQKDQCAGDLGQSAWQLSDQLARRNIQEVELSNRLERARAMLQFHIGQIEQSIETLTIVLANHPGDGLAAVTLARAYMQRGKYRLAAAESLKIIEQGTPEQRIYWQALLVNLSAHTKLTWRANQIVNAIVSRQGQYPDLGGPAIKASLEKILAQNRERKDNQTSQPPEGN